MIQWYYCEIHGDKYPKGSVCPHCSRDFYKLMADASSIDWRDVIPVDMCAEFYENESAYTANETNEFKSYTGHDENKKLKLRAAVLIKRREFLDKWIQQQNERGSQNVYKPKDCN